MPCTAQLLSLSLWSPQRYLMCCRPNYLHQRVAKLIQVSEMTLLRFIDGKENPMNSRVTDQNFKNISHDNGLLTMATVRKQQKSLFQQLVPLQSSRWGIRRTPTAEISRPHSVLYSTYDCTAIHQEILSRTSLSTVHHFDYNEAKFFAGGRDLHRFGELSAGNSVITRSDTCLRNLRNALA